MFPPCKFMLVELRLGYNPVVVPALPKIEPSTWINTKDEIMKKRQREVFGYMSFAFLRLRLLSFTVGVASSSSPSSFFLVNAFFGCAEGTFSLFRLFYFPHATVVSPSAPLP